MAQQTAKTASDAPVHPGPLPAWGAMRYPVFRWLWLATVFLYDPMRYMIFTPGQVRARTKNLIGVPGP